MKDRQQLEQFILGKLGEIQREYEHYPTQFPAVLSAWEEGNHHLSLTIFEDNRSAMGLVFSEKIEDGICKNTYTIDVSSRYGDEAVGELSRKIEDMSAEDLRKGINYGKDNTDE